MTEENTFYKEDHERLTRQIYDLKCELRKFEYEIEDLTEKKHQETTNFINNLPRKTNMPPINSTTREKNDNVGSISFRNGNLKILDKMINIFFIFLSFGQRKQYIKEFL